jgi:hypothetical protein
MVVGRGGAQLEDDLAPGAERLDADRPRDLPPAGGVEPGERRRGDLGERDLDVPELPDRPDDHLAARLLLEELEALAVVDHLIDAEAAVLLRLLPQQTPRQGA